MKDYVAGSTLWLQAVQAVLAVLCVVAYEALLLSGGGEGFGLTKLMALFIVLTNMMWLAAMGDRRERGMSFGLWPAWVMNFCVAGTQLCWGMTVLTEARRDWLMPMMIAVPIAGVVSAAVLWRAPKWLVAGLAAIAGLALLGVGITMVANHENHNYGKWTRLFLFVSGIDMAIYGMALALPLSLGCVLLWRRARAVSATLCRRCGYDLRGTLMAGKVMCPECGEERVSSKKMER
jgi:predicted RNA-binding Zn-ribbon protein involved in translation (DUF1610 family)